MTPSPSSLSPIPPPIPVDTHPNRAPGSRPPEQDRIPDPDRLAPEDAYFAPSLSRVRSAPANYEESLRSLNGDASGVATLRPPRGTLGVDLTRKDGRKLGAAGPRRRRKGAWKKLLWVKQSYPDNYTDTETFLDHLQRNPRVRPYDFWPLVSDSTVIVQHVCSVVIFVCCFVGIVQDRVSPVSIVCWGSVGTAMGWILWDNWIWREQAELAQSLNAASGGDDESSSSSMTSAPNPSGNDQGPNGTKGSPIHGLGLTMSTNESKEQISQLTAEIHGSLEGIGDPALRLGPSSATPSIALGSTDAQDTERASLFSSRNRQRLSTVKSAFLIYFSLLGLSPILKSLTKSTASDSIWALSCWLLIMNIFSFDYGSGEGAGATTKFPASLSTNAAVMASTVLASRLPSTTHVFSLMLFSMEVFGLFPIFRRQLRQISWTGHVILTLALVIIAGGAVGTTLGGGWASAVIGSFLGSVLTAFSMGGCSWWLISLQKYKNVVIGPWDPARPIIRRHWN
ncbi:uncharacterized protein N7473_009333 [Penicillium subrubescens]|uniref:Phosphatidylinositol N-acetylglucosaminyltransferase GPI2 subunit n=1 Tax=Penicillium subrubescens TaxID=1316194 RepID=A0A1Q5TAV5_9EURO|nr:uncharacterized protein N7473_009333 [Penicillium subrubescens]KAJ5886659.1 hypothetical protein N7473_009333 [Penicillium subrubescens]OKO97328.1 Phosphatidylinositol N-acetylglucosaminyltransferase GPI2 subunit [Penicillium subrubescens]